ncbi:DNA repair protein RadA [Aestuariivirga sp. YIM B02566]|uniref:DNA repair protein RadA n=1 Tax=Taklimakanibacter albus TaxID=2800327 RepID=A0ACC5R033_9HYPH|nr:DNA repair protein RadA [Aestuariivirga sp. YIM B02566]MBK1865965.1 DNA repair protein RadA [Aestuariivirga sp. YIM B02566]
MAKSLSQFVCQSCGAVSSKWAGRCDNCGEWNTIIEESAPTPLSGAKGASLPKGRPSRLVGLKGESAAPARIETGIAELDRVAGGGFVPGSGVLIGGDPGIGKSTLLLQAMAALANRGRRVIYVSGEEAIAQVRLRAERLGIAETSVLLAAETNAADIVATLSEDEPPAIAVIDSIQTVWSPNIDAAPGTVSQLKAGSEALIRFAKQKGTTILLVGHVTKDGQIAGPKVIEHMVDTVLYFEGDRGHQYRILRAVKNRFGPTDEIGVFEMSDGGLKEVANPSRLFMGSGEHPTPGSAVFAGVEGTRPLLIEVQALVSPSPFGNPRRTVVGWDANRLAMVLAVLEARAGVTIGNHDVYLNVAGGLKVKETAADLAVAAALLSSLTGTIVPHGTTIFGEIALSGAIRPVSLAEARVKEAQKLGLKEAVTAARPELSCPKGFRIKPLETIADLVAWAAAQPKGLARIA